MKVKEYYGTVTIGGTTTFTIPDDLSEYDEIVCYGKSSGLTGSAYVKFTTSPEYAFSGIWAGILAGITNGMVIDASDKIGFITLSEAIGGSTLYADVGRGVKFLRATISNASAGSVDLTIICRRYD